jgi:hypothetical protein
MAEGAEAWRRSGVTTWKSPGTATGAPQEIDGVQTSTKAEGTSAVDVIAIPRNEWHRMKVFAESWLRFWAGDHLDDLVDWRIRSISRDLSSSLRWSKLGPRHAELERRRRITSVLECSACGVAVEVEHPIEPWQFDLLPDTSWVRCAAHKAVPA